MPRSKRSGVSGLLAAAEIAAGGKRRPKAAGNAPFPGTPPESAAEETTLPPRSKKKPAKEKKPGRISQSGGAPGAAPKEPDTVPLRVIGVDPGLASTGWGVLEVSKGRLRYIAHGCIETGAETPRGERLHFIYTSFLGVLKTYKPAEAAIENLYFGKNISSAMVVAEARGVLLMALSGRGLPVRELTPNAIKKAVAGVTRAEKRQVQEMVRFILGLKEIPKPDHAADALAAAICAAHTGFRPPA